MSCSFGHSNHMSQRNNSENKRLTNTLTETWFGSLNDIVVMRIWRSCVRMPSRHGYLWHTDRETIVERQHNRGQRCKPNRNSVQQRHQQPRRTCVSVVAALRSAKWSSMMMMMTAAAICCICASIDRYVRMISKVHVHSVALFPMLLRTIANFTRILCDRTKLGGRLLLSSNNNYFCFWFDLTWRITYIWKTATFWIELIKIHKTCYHCHNLSLLLCLSPLLHSEKSFWN